MGHAVVSVREEIMTELPLPEIEGTSIVLVGSFNPRIFQPSWFVRHRLLPEGAEESANIEVINNDVAAWGTDNFRVEVIGARFMLHGVAMPAVEILRDLAAGAFAILSHTPVQMIGLNSEAHYPWPNEESWHSFGHLLAPKERFWTPILDKAGTRSLVVEGARPDDFAGHVVVKVEPSRRVQPGVYIETNDEFRNLSSGAAEWVQDVLVNYWDESRQRVTSVRNHLLSEALKGDA
jgi:hypothetical protein